MSTIDPLTNNYLLTVAEASNCLAVAPVTLRRWIRLGLLPSVRLGRARRVRLGDIEALARIGLRPAKGAQ